MNNVVPLVLGSAAIGALDSSVITVCGQYFERKARRKELLLNVATQLSLDHHRMLFDTAKAKPGGSYYIPDAVRLVQTHYQGLSDLLSVGKLPPGMFQTADPIEQEKFAERFRK